MPVNRKAMGLVRHRPKKYAPDHEPGHHMCPLCRYTYVSTGIPDVMLREVLQMKCGTDICPNCARFINAGGIYWEEEDLARLQKDERKKHEQSQNE